MAIREVIGKEKGLPDNFKEALKLFFDTNDEGQIVVWDMDPQEMELSDSDESDEEMDEERGSRPDRIWLQSTKTTLQRLAAGANTELAYRGWLPEHWQGALEDLGMDAVAAEAFLGRIDKVIFDRFKDVWEPRNQIIEPRTETQILRDEFRKTSNRKKQLHAALNKDIRCLIARNHELQGDKIRIEGWELRWTLKYKQDWVAQYGEKIIASAPTGKRKNDTGNHGTRDIRQLMPPAAQTHNGQNTENNSN